jgi:hypothetical protein
LQGLAVEVLQSQEGTRREEIGTDVLNGPFDAPFGKKCALQIVAKVSHKFSQSRIPFIRYEDRALKSSRCATIGVEIASRMWAPMGVYARCRWSGLMSTSLIWSSR